MKSLVGSVVLVLCCGAQPVRAVEDSVVGRKVAEFELRDFRGKTHRLGDYSDHQLLVVAYLGTECPLAKIYAPKLVALSQRYDSADVAFVAINANVQDSITEIAAYARRHHIEFPILKDVGNRIADQMDAQRTPEVFLLDKDRIIRYRGRIDDQHGVDYNRTKATRHDLKIAIDELLAGGKVSKPETDSNGCFIGRVREARANSEVTYTGQIAKILRDRCVECHRTGEIAPFALTDYEEVAGWAETIDEVVKEQRMPPWHAESARGHFRNDRSLTPEEKKLIHDWVAAGAPRGEGDTLPPLPPRVTGWQLERAPGSDADFPIAKRAVRVPATGAVRYQYFRVNPRFTEDKWFSAVEVKPGNHAVVHHILVFAKPPRGFSDDFGGGVRGFLAGYVPGRRAKSFPKGYAKRIPANSELIFQVHYTPIGSAQTDLSRVGFLFVDPQDVTHEVKTVSSFQRRLRIPPGEENHRVAAWPYRISSDAQLLSLMPHMHLRGKSVKYDVEFPDGVRKTVLDVPEFDFNWQTSYRLTEPMELPAGTRMHCVAHFDNSESNLNNPDSTKTVRWGDQTWDEMMIGYFDIAFPK